MASVYRDYPRAGTLDSHKSCDVRQQTLKWDYATKADLKVDRRTWGGIGVANGGA